MTPAEALAEAARALGASAPSADAFVGIEQGVRYSVRIDDDDGVPSRFAVDVPLKGLASVALEPEGEFARLGKRLGLSTEIQLGDPEFDPHVYIETEVDEAIVRAYLASPEARAAIAEIAKGGDDVHLTAEGAHAWLRSDHGFEVDRVVRTVRALARFVAALPRPLPAFAAQPAPRGWPLRLALDLLLTAAAFPLLVARFRRRSSGFESIVVTSLGISLFVLPVGPTIVSLTNASLDEPATARAGTIVSASCFDGEDGPGTDVTIEVDGTEYQVQVPGCETLAPGSAADALISPGGLGLERVHGVQVR